MIGLEGNLAIGAYAGAVALITGWIDLGDAARRLPFGSQVLGGLALALVNGALPTVVFVGALHHRAWAGVGHLIVGGALVAWVIVQVALLGWLPHWLQSFYFLDGLLIVVLSVATLSLRRE